MQLPNTPTTETTPRQTFLVMKLAAIFLLVGVMLILFFHSNLQEGFFTRKQSVGVPDLDPAAERPAAYDFQFVSNGHLRSLVDYRGQIVHINFWAHWCKPCEAELPVLEKMQKEFAGQYQVILINLDQGTEAIQRARDLQQQHAPSLTSIYEGTKVIEEKMQVPALPYHIVIDKNGKKALGFLAPLDKYESDFRRPLLQLFAEGALAE